MQIKLSELPLPEDQHRLLHDFLLQEVKASPENQYWSTERLYTFRSNDKDVSFCFDRDFFLRPRKEGRPGLRFEILAEDVLGEGGAGTVYQTHSMKITSEGLVIENKDRLIKEVNSDAEGSFITSEKEAHFMIRAGHLDAKKPTLIKKNGRYVSFLTMKKMPGEELYYFVDTLIGELRASFSLPLLSNVLKKWFLISDKLLRVTKEQSHDRGIVHRDLKLANFVVNEQKGAFQLNTIDYGMSISQLEEKGSLEENPLLALSDPQIDVMSLGKILNELWSDYFLDKLPLHVRNPLQDLIAQMKKGFNALVIDTRKPCPAEWHGLHLGPNPKDWSVEQLTILMQGNHGFLQINKSLYFINDEMKISKVSHAFDYRISKAANQVTTLGADVLVMIEAATQFVPPERVQKEGISLNDCIKKLREIIGEYQKTLSEKEQREFCLESLSSRKRKADSAPDKSPKDWSKEISTLRSRIGFFSSIIIDHNKEMPAENTNFLDLRIFVPNR